MKIRCSGIFKNMVGDDEIDLSLKDPVTVKELSEIVTKIIFFKNSSNFYPHFIRYTEYLKFFRSNRILHELDLVYDNDSLEMFIPSVGG